MCWNEDISLNTFLFVCVSLIFIFVSNTYTKYKTPTFDNPLVYLLLFAVASMQLVEFFLWRNLKNNYMNEILSIIGAYVIILQQIIIMLIIPNSTFRYSMLFLYALFIIAFRTLYTKIFNTYYFHTSVGKNGHLSWNWMNYKGVDNMWLGLGLLFYIIPLLLLNKPLLAFFMISTMFLSLFFYLKYNTFGTMWCWGINLFLLYFVIDILLIQPYCEYNSLC